LGLTAVGHTKIACQRWGDELNEAIRAVRTSQQEVLTQQHLLVEIENDLKRLGLPLDKKPIQPTGISWGHSMKLDFLALYILKHRGREYASYLVQNIPEAAEQWIANYRLDFYERYYPGVLTYMPEEVKNYVLQQLERYEIALYSEADWQAFIKIRENLRQTRQSYLMKKPLLSVSATDNTGLF
ncbi:hypothetical protein BUY80_17355, partial [Staphylococcus equorum]